MTRHVVTPTALRHIDEIAAFIEAHNQIAADRYTDITLQCFEEVTPRYIGHRASPRLPDYVREYPVSGFRPGYVIRVAFLDDRIGLVAAFRPGLTGHMRDGRTRPGLRELRDWDD